MIMLWWDIILPQFLWWDYYCRIIHIKIYKITPGAGKCPIVNKPYAPKEQTLRF